MCVVCVSVCVWLCECVLSVCVCTHPVGGASVPEQHEEQSDPADEQRAPAVPSPPHAEIIGTFSRRSVTWRQVSRET